MIKRVWLRFDNLKDFICNKLSLTLEFRAFDISDYIMAVTFGINLGNTSVCLSMNRDGHSKIVANDAGDRVTPAVVALNGSEWEIGLAAKAGQARNLPVVINNKRLLDDRFKIDACGDTFNGCKISGEDPVKYELPSNDSTIYVTPHNIATKLFAKQYTIAGSAAQDDGELSAVLACPLYWSEASRQKFSTAAELAGFNVLQVISEPVAAALAYGVCEGNSKDELILVYRLGGTSCDVTILRSAGGLISVEHNIHRSELGGKNITDVLAEYIASEFCYKWKLDPRESRRSMGKLFNHADNCKHILSTLGSAHVFVESLCDGVDWSQNVSRARFENLITPLLTSFTEPVQTLLKGNDLASKINKVILSGGSMKIPKVQSAVTAIFPNAEILVSTSPDEVIAEGCAKQAALLIDLPNLNIKSVNAQVEIIPRSIFSKCLDNKVKLFASGSPLYSQFVWDICNSDDKEDVEITVYEACDDNTEEVLGVFSLPLKQNGSCKAVLEEAGIAIYAV